MILSALRLIRSLSGYHYRTIILTILLPVIGPPVFAYFGPDLIVVRIILYVAAFSVWTVIAVLAVAYMASRDTSEAEHLMSQKLEMLSSRIGRLREDHEESRVDLRQQVENLEDTVRSTFEELEVDLRARRISVRAKPSHFSISTSVDNVTVVRGSKVARLRQWFRHAARWLWEVIYGKSADS